MGMWNKYLCRTVLLCAIVSTAHAVSHGAALGPVVLEGFEDPSAATTNTAVKIISSGPGLAQGKSAARLDPGGTVTLKVRPSDIARLPWLRIDTHHAAEGTRGLGIAVSCGTVAASVQGYVATGKDTLAYPLSMVMGPATKAADTQLAAVTITNISDTPIVVDNIRIEPLVRTPPGAVLWDFGGSVNWVWPGFTAHGVSGNGVKWKSDPSYYAGYNLPYPDPLTKDFIGPYRSSLGNNKKTQVAITAPEPKSMSAWLWVTHYGKRFTQPRQYLCRAAMGRPVSRTLTPGQMVGPDGLLEGAGGDWTPQWYATDYADHFVSVMPFNLPKGKTVLELGNCQMAALAMVPSSGRSSMTASIKHIQNELARFRRQFMMKQLNRNLCTLEPTEAEKKIGMMLFRPPGDEAFSGLWKPRADQRAWALHELAQPGGTIHIPLAYVPLRKKSLAFSVISGPLRSESNSTLLLNRSNLRVDHVQLVPEVREGITIRRPWLLGARPTPVAAGQIGYLWLTVSISPLAKEGQYRGTWKLGSGASRISVPVEIEIVSCGRQEKDASGDFTIASYGLPSASTAYSAALSALPKSKQLKLKSDVFRQAAAAGVNAYEFTGVEISSGSSSGTYVLSESDIQGILNEYPLKDMSGPMFVNVNQAMSRLGWGASEKKRALLNKTIARCNELSMKYSLGQRYFYFGYGKTLAGTATVPGLKARLAGAKIFASEDCRVVIHTLSSTLNSIKPADFNAALAPVSALILMPNSSATASQIEAFGKLSGIRKVYLYTPIADRYKMGFYAAAVRADGCFLSGLFMTGGPYNGYSLDGNGLVAPRLGGALAQTVSALRIKQAQSDRKLVSQARTLVSRATRAAVSAKEISEVLSEIELRAKALTSFKYDYTQFATTAVSQAEMDSWRTSLLNAMGVVHKRIPDPRR